MYLSVNKKAFVKEIVGDKAILSIKRECMCAGQNNCSKVCFTLQSDVLEVAIDNEIGAKAGDFVEVEGQTSMILIYCDCFYITDIYRDNTIFYYVVLYYFRRWVYIVNRLVVLYIK